MQNSRELSFANILLNSFLGCFILFHVRRLLSSMYDQLVAAPLLLFIWTVPVDSVSCNHGGFDS